MSGHTVTVNTREGRAYLDGVEVPVTAAELALLEVLAREPTRIIPRRDLWQVIGWDPINAPWTTSRALDSHLARLRRKLRRVAPGVSWCPVAWSRGWSLVNP